jgi:hypothetical protein
MNRLFVLYKSLLVTVNLLDSELRSGFNVAYGYTARSYVLPFLKFV